jgi:hypothetical protein
LFVSQQGTDPVMISTDKGAHWVDYSDTLVYFVNCVFEHQGLVYGGTNGIGVIYHENANWNWSNQGLPTNNNIWAFADAGDTLFCGGDSIGVWMNYNGTWMDFSCGLPTLTNVRKLASTGSHLLVGTQNSGIWSINLQSPCSNTNAINQVEVLPSLQVSPNPSLSSWQLTTGAELLGAPLQVFDADGRIIFSGKVLTPVMQLYLHIAAGIYLMRIDTGDGAMMRKLVKL